jgi:hypothetical protein
MTCSSDSLDNLTPSRKLTHNANSKRLDALWSRRFDPQDLATSRFDVSIDTASVNTRDGERDQTIKSADLFNVKQYPTARYVAEKFTAKGKGQYSASGKLTRSQTNAKRIFKSPVRSTSTAS